MGTGRPDSCAVQEHPHWEDGRISPDAALLDLLPFFKARSKTASGGGTDRKADHARLESVARKIAAMPESEIIGTEPGR